MIEIMQEVGSWARVVGSVFVMILIVWAVFETLNAVKEEFKD